MTNFKPCLYQTIHIQSRSQFKQLINSIQHDHQAGLYVKYLFFDYHVRITKDEFKILFQRLPLLEKVDFNPDLWKYFPYQQQQHTDTTVDWKKIKILPLLNRLDIARLVYPKYNSSLTEISIASSCFVNNNFVSFYKAVARSSQQPLRRLQVYGECYTEFTLHNLINTHTEVPLLEELELLDFTFVPSSLDDNIYYLAVAKHQQYKGMKRLHLRGKISHPNWISLISQLYPNLFDLDLDLKIYAGQQEEQGITKDGLVSIAKECLSLGAIKLYGIDSSLLEAFYAILASTSASRRRKIKSIDYITPANTTKSLAAAVLNCCNSQETHALKLQLWRDLLSFDTIIHSISTHCHHLKSLELSCGKYAFSWNYGFNLNSIFKECLELKQLVLSMGKMTISENNNAHYTTRLESVALNQVHFTTKSINYLTSSCPKLKQFEILDCIKDRDILQQKISIDLSHQWQLDTLKIQRIYLGLSRYIEKSSIDIALLSITPPKDQEGTTRYYHLNNVRCGKDRKNTRQLSRLDKNQSHKVATYEMLQKDWDHLEQEMTVRGTYREFKYWASDLPFGQLELICGSDNVKKILFNDKLNSGENLRLLHYSKHDYHQRL